MTNVAKESWKRQGDNYALENSDRIVKTIWQIWRHIHGQNYKYTIFYQYLQTPIILGSDFRLKFHGWKVKLTWWQEDLQTECYASVACGDELGLQTIYVLTDIDNLVWEGQIYMLIPTPLR